MADIYHLATCKAVTGTALLASGHSPPSGAQGLWFCRGIRMAGRQLITLMEAVERDEVTFVCMPRDEVVGALVARDGIEIRRRVLSRSCRRRTLEGRRSILHESAE